MAGVFEGVRVIELAQYVYVPGAGVMLADQGAEVIKIETIDGDPYRTLRVGADRNLGDINIAPFSHEAYGTTFGLIAQPPEEEDEDWTVIAEPGNYMAFYPPWDGDYDT